MKTRWEEPSDSHSSLLWKASRCWGRKRELMQSTDVSLSWGDCATDPRRQLQGVHGTEHIDERAAGKENCEDTQRVQPDCSKECRRIHSCEKTSQKRWKGWPNRQEDMLPLSVPSRQTRKPIILGALSKFPWGAQKDDVLITGIVNSRQSITSVLSHKP